MSLAKKSSVYIIVTVMKMEGDYIHLGMSSLPNIN